MKNINKSYSSLYQVIVSFLVLYLATVVVIFIPDFDYEIIRFSLLSALFVISFMFQFYILKERVKNEKKSKEQLKRLLMEQDKTARMLIRRDRKLSETNKRLREVDILKSEFVSIAAHQLRTPLSGIKWSLEILLGEHFGKINEKQKGIALKSYESNERMISLVNNLLNVDRIESGRNILKYTKVKAENLMEGVLYYINPLLNNKNIKLNLSMDSNLPMIEVDIDKVREATQNIIENAIKYSKDGGQIDVSLNVRKNNLIITIRDDGIGIPEEFKDMVFTKFSRGENTLKINTEGSGLGLFVAKEIMEKHGGKIWFESKEDGGTTFYVSIPVLSEEKNKEII